MMYIIEGLNSIGLIEELYPQKPAKQAMHSPVRTMT